MGCMHAIPPLHLCLLTFSTLCFPQVWHTASFEQCCMARERSWLGPSLVYFPSHIYPSHPSPQYGLNAANPPPPVSSHLQPCNLAHHRLRVDLYGITIQPGDASSRNHAPRARFGGYHAAQRHLTAATVAARAAGLALLQVCVDCPSP